MNEYLRPLSDQEWEEYLKIFPIEGHAETDDDPYFPCERETLFMDEKGNIISEKEEIPGLSEEDQQETIKWLRSIWETRDD